MSRPARVLLGDKFGRDVSDLTRLALMAWPVILTRTSYTPEEAAEAAYIYAEAMLETTRLAEGAYDLPPWRGGAK